MMSKEKRKKTNKSKTYNLSGAKYINCEVCSSGSLFVSNQKIQKFLESKHMDNICDHCNKIFFNLCAIKMRNLSPSDSQVVYVCDTCNKSFTFIENLKKHRAIHDRKVDCFIENQKDSDENEKEISNNISDDSIEKEKVLSNKQEYRCNFCNKSFELLNNLLRHRLSHMTQNIEKECEEFNGSKKENENSTNTGENSSNNDIKKLSSKQEHRCNFCDKSFKHLRDLTRHRSSHMKKNIKTEYEVKFNGSKKESESTNTGENSSNNDIKKLSSKQEHRCNFCDKSFKHLRNLTRHRLSHMKKNIKKEYEAKFNGSKNESESTNTGENSSNKDIKKLSSKQEHRCNFCYKSFGHLRNLIRHRSSHMKKNIKKEYKVKFNGSKKESESTNAGENSSNEDIKKLSSKQEYRCNFCYKSFGHLKNLLRHRSSHMKKNIKKEYEVKLNGSKKENENTNTNTVENSSNKDIKKLSSKQEYRCNFCYKSFGLLKNLLRHRQSHMKENMRKEYKVKFNGSRKENESINYGENFSNKDITLTQTDLQNHVDSICKEPVTPVRNIEKHNFYDNKKIELTHTVSNEDLKEEKKMLKNFSDNEKEYKICPKTFYGGNIVIETLKNFNYFKCSICRLKFESLTECKVHERDCGKVFTCNSCSIIFTNVSALRRHVFIKNSEEASSCNYCKGDYKSICVCMHKEIVII